MGIFAWLWLQIVRGLLYIVPNRWMPTSLLQKVKSKVDKATTKAPTRKPFRITWLLVLHIVLVIIVFVALCYVNWVFDLDKVLRSPWPILHRVWLPLLFLLGYALCWLGWYLWKTLGPEGEPEPYPDIDEAWAEGVKALKDAGIDLGRTPLYLVLGRPLGSVDDLFYASQLPLQVRTVPRRADAPLHVYANKEGIFITCEGASLLGRAAELLAPRPNLGASNTTLSPSGPAQMLQMPKLGGPVNPAPPGEPLQPAAESRSMSSTAELLVPEPTTRTLHRQPLRLLQNIDETERLTARLKYLCRLIARQRQPFCPVNGLLILAPLAATDNDPDAYQTGLVIQRDMRSVRESMRVRCPVQTALCDVEALPGFLDLMGQFKEERQRQQLLGRTFPLAPQIEAEQFPRMVTGGLEWLCQTLLPSVVYQFLQGEKPGDESAAEVLQRNARLVQLLGELRERQPRWSHILTQGLAAQEKQLPLLGGAFLCATGPDAVYDQAFVHDVFRLLIENQNYVSWTAEAVEENRDYQRWTWLSYLGIVLLLTALVFLAYHVWLRA